jgi:hypothetical protein
MYLFITLIILKTLKPQALSLSIDFLYKFPMPPSTSSTPARQLQKLKVTRKEQVIRVSRVEGIRIIKVIRVFCVIKVIKVICVIKVIRVICFIKVIRVTRFSSTQAHQLQNLKVIWERRVFRVFRVIRAVKVIRRARKDTE